MIVRRFASAVAFALALIPSLAHAAVTADNTFAAALEQIKAGHCDRAIKLLRPAVKRSPSDVDSRNLLGVCESELGNPKAAEEAFLSGLRAAPDATAIRENLGLLYFRTGNYTAAKAQLATVAATGSAKPEVEFSLAASEVRTGEEQKGLDLLRRLETQLAKRSQYWTERGWVELKLDPPAAALSFGRALELNPDDARALNGAASDAEAHGDNEKALSHLIRARKAQPDDLRILLHFASICIRGDLAIDAAEALQRARAIAPGNRLAVFLSAQTETAFQHWQKAHDLFEEFKIRVPGYAPAEYAMGWLDRKLNRPEEARRHLTRSLDLDSDLLDARCELAKLDLDDANFAEAERGLRRVLDANARHLDALIAMGDIELHRGELDRAQEFYEKAISIDAGSGPAHYKLSTVLLRKHVPEQASAERELGMQLQRDQLQKSKTVLRLSEPNGSLLSEGAR